MSVFDKLKEVQDVRQNKYSQSLQRSPVELAQRAVSAQTTSPEFQSQSFKAQTWLLKGILALLVVLVLEAGFIIGLLLRNPSAERREAQPKSIQAALDTEVKAPGKIATTAPATTTKSSKVIKSSPQKTKNR